MGERLGGGDGDWWIQPMVPILTCRATEEEDKKAGGARGANDSWDPPDGVVAAVTGRPQVLLSSYRVVAQFP